MFVENLTPETIKDLFLRKFNHITSIINLAEFGGEGLYVEYGYAEAGNWVRHNLIITDYEVRYLFDDQDFDNYTVSAYHTINLREYLSKVYGEEYDKALDEYKNKKSALNKTISL